MKTAKENKSDDGSQDPNVCILYITVYKLRVKRKVQLNGEHKKGSACHIIGRGS